MHGDEQRPLWPSGCGTWGWLVMPLIKGKVIRKNVWYKLKLNKPQNLHAEYLINFNCTDYEIMVKNGLNKYTRPTNVRGSSGLNVLGKQWTGRNKWYSFVCALSCRTNECLKAKENLAGFYLHVRRELLWILVSEEVRKQMVVESGQAGKYKNIFV